MAAPCASGQGQHDVMAAGVGGQIRHAIVGAADATRRQGSQRIAGDAASMGRQGRQRIAGDAPSMRGHGWQIRLPLAWGWIGGQGGQ